MKGALLLCLGLLLGCSNPPPTPSGATSTPSATPSDAPATVEPSEPAVRPPPEVTTLPTGPAAFVLYTLEQTVVIPLDGREPVRAEGLWLQDDRTSPAALSHSLILSPSRIERMGIGPCPCGNLDGGCTPDNVSTTRFHPNTGTVTPESDAQCRCVHPKPSWGIFPPDPADVDGEVYEPCLGGNATSPVSLVGGRLYWLGYEWNGACYGALSLYDAYEFVDPLAAPAGSVDLERARPYGCTYELDDMPDQEPPWPLPDSLCRPGRGDDCSCMDDDYFESQVFTVRRGWVWRVQDEVSHAGGSRRIARARARPDRCPGLNDPCGDPEPFGPRPKGYRREFWVMTDGTARLSATRYDYQLSRQDAAYPPVRFELPGVHASTDVIGIRQHTDVGPLLAVMRRHASRGAATATPPDEATCTPPVLRPTDATFVDTRGGRGWGDRCFIHIQLRNWNAAEATCLRGLEVATEDETRGALLYNLGRVAEGRGLVGHAMEQYRRSLVVRPNNAAVRKRLATLERRHPSPAPPTDDP